MAISRWPTQFWMLVAALAAAFCGPAAGQPPASQPVHFRVQQPGQRLEMIVHTSRILTLERNVPRLLVMNPDIVEARPLSPNQVQISARQPGVTQVNLWDDQEQLYSVEVVVYGDARQLEDVLKAQFPEASLKLTPLPSSIVISGYVPQADMVSRIVRIAEDFYPKVINNMTVGGVQQVLLYVKVMEVSRTKLRKLGFDWANFNMNDVVIQNAAGLVSDFALAGDDLGATSNLGETMAFGIVTDHNSFFGFLEALRRHNLVKVLAEPTLVTVSGRPASFNSGGEIPILIPQALGTLSVEYRQFGTRVDFLPIVLGNGAIRLEVRPQVSEIDPARSVTLSNVTIPGLRTRWVDTAVEMRAGQTLALAGLIQTRVESENKGLPWVSDLPWVGAAFRRVEERNNEVELLITVTPEFVDALDAHQVPALGPGQGTATPSDRDFYWRGYLETPNGSFCEPSPAGLGDVAPAAAAAPASSRRLHDSPHNPSPPNDPAHGASPPAADAPSADPGLIGPLGYDLDN